MTKINKKLATVLLYSQFKDRKMNRNVQRDVNWGKLRDIKVLIAA